MNLRFGASSPAGVRGEIPPQVPLTLRDGSRVAVIGGGPAGSFFANFLLQFAGRSDLDIGVDIYEPRDFWDSGPAGCNMCGGIISESLVQSLMLEGIKLPGNIVQRGIDGYVLHTDCGHCRIETPSQEKRIAAVHRGGGPRGSNNSQWESFDAHLMMLAVGAGAKFYCSRVVGLGWQDGRPTVEAKGQPPQAYDLLVGAVGMNSPDLKLFEQLGFGYQRPAPTKTYITELQLRPEILDGLFHNDMHVFLLNIPRLEFAALIPKGQYVTLCMLGENIDAELVRRFMDHPAVRSCLPAGWTPPASGCHCSPKMFFGDPVNPFGDRVVMIGDCGVSRLFKDGIGAAFKTSKAAARTAVFHGISREAFHRHYRPTCDALSWDNRLGRAIFAGVEIIKRLEFPSEALLRVTEGEQLARNGRKPLSMILWDTFTGSSTYRDVLYRGLRPSLVGRVCAHSLVAAGSRIFASRRKVEAHSRPN